MKLALVGAWTSGLLFGAAYANEGIRRSRLCSGGWSLALAGLSAALRLPASVVEKNKR